MIPVEKIEKAINLLHDKDICSINSSYVYFTRRGQYFCTNKDGMNWCEIRHGDGLWAPVKEELFDGENWSSIWHWVSFSMMTDIMFRNFCKYFEIEDEMYADENSVYLTDEEDFVV